MNQGDASSHRPPTSNTPSSVWKSKVRNILWAFGWKNFFLCWGGTLRMHFLVKQVRERDKMGKNLGKFSDIFCDTGDHQPELFFPGAKNFRVWILPPRSKFRNSLAKENRRECVIQRWRCKKQLRVKPVTVKLLNYCLHSWIHESAIDYAPVMYRILLACAWKNLHRALTNFQRKIPGTKNTFSTRRRKMRRRRDEKRSAETRAAKNSRRIWTWQMMNLLCFLGLTSGKYSRWVRIFIFFPLTLPNYFFLLFFIRANVFSLCQRTCLPTHWCAPPPHTMSISLLCLTPRSIFTEKKNKETPTKQRKTTKEHQCSFSAV